MENQRTILIILLIFIATILYTNWLRFEAEQAELASQPKTEQSFENQAVMTPSPDDTVALPAGANQPAVFQGDTSNFSASQQASLITVETDVIVARINPLGGVIESIELLDEPIALDKPDQGFPLLMNDRTGKYVAQDGLLAAGQTSPNHASTNYQIEKTNYELGQSDVVKVPLVWRSDDGVEYIKTFTFSRDSYVVDIDYQVNNRSAAPWAGYLYAQFSRTEPADSGGGFGQMPSYTGGAIYNEEDKYQKVKFKEIEKENLSLNTNNGWVSMMQHYFVTAWLPQSGQAMEFYSSLGGVAARPEYRIGYKTLTPEQVAPGQSGNIGTRVYLGSKEQARLKRIAKEEGVDGLALTVDYGFLTFIADPLFVALAFINKFIGNWGWSIIVLTFLIKLAFYPLSAASYKSMAKMKKIQPRMQTLKERYPDDRQKFQAEMMALYKKEKINPAGGCLPILIQIPVFIALYWVLLESVEMRQAPFALWLQDLSVKDPYYVLPILMGLTMFLQQKLNPAPMEEMQKRIMMIMPIALTFLFLSFPQGLVLYWVVNNILSIAQQWLINKQHGAA
jgi:YidC/Oxa1 family membrane protein insertase